MNKSKIGCSLLIAALAMVAAFLAIPDNSLIVKELTEREPTGNEIIEIDIPKEPQEVQTIEGNVKKITYEDGIYEGETSGNERNGQGIFRYEHKNAYYDGEWENNRKHGKGKYEDGKIMYVGEFKYGEFNGEGILTYKNNYGPDKRYEGDFKNGMRQGEGIFYEVSGNRKIYLYEGEWKNNSKHGKGTEYGTTKYIGTFRNGERDGTGYIYDNRKNTKTKVEYIKGELFKSMPPEEI